MVDVADAAVLHGGEAEARLDRAVGVQGPFAGVAVPARLQFGHQGDLLAVDPDGGAQEIAGVAAALDDRARLSGGEPEARRHVGAGCAQEALLVLPVAIGPAGVAVVLHVEDRDMGAVQDLAAAIDDVPQLHAAAGIAGRRRRADGGEGPIDGRAAPDGDGVTARHPLAGGGLESRGRRPHTGPNPATAAFGARAANRWAGPPVRSTPTISCVASWPASRGSRPTVTSRRSPVPASQHRGHRPVGDQLAGTQARPDLPMANRHRAPRSIRPATGWAGCSGRIHGRARCRRGGPPAPASL